MSDDTSTNPSTVLIRYPNLSGALVFVMEAGAGSPDALTWFCQGCMDRAYVLNLGMGRDHANTHAATCRALPPTTAA